MFIFGYKEYWIRVFFANIYIGFGSLTNFVGLSCHSFVYLCMHCVPQLIWVGNVWWILIRRLKTQFPFCFGFENKVSSIEVSAVWTACISYNYSHDCHLQLTLFLNGKARTKFRTAGITSMFGLMFTELGTSQTKDRGRVVGWGVVFYWQLTLTAIWCLATRWWQDLSNKERWLSKQKGAILCNIFGLFNKL